MMEPPTYVARRIKSISKSATFESITSDIQTLMEMDDHILDRVRNVEIEVKAISKEVKEVVDISKKNHDEILKMLAVKSYMWTAVMAVVTSFTVGANFSHILNKVIHFFGQ